MKIVYIRSSNIYDDSRATKEILALAEANHLIYVLGWNRNGLAEEKTREVFSNFGNIFYYFYNGKVSEQLISKVNDRINWSKWIKHTIMSIDSFDFIHCCDFDTGYAVYQLHKKNGFPYNYDIYDYYNDSHNVPKTISPIIAKLENKIIENATVTIICTEERQKQIGNAKPNNLVVIHNSPEVKIINETEEIYDYAYCGGLFNSRLIGEILDGYSNHSDISMAFVGTGSFEKELVQLSTTFPNMYYFGSKKYNEVLDIENKTRVISAIYDPKIRNHRYCAPNKFYEALGLGKPIIVCKGTGIDKIVRDYNLGLVIDYNAESFYNALLTLLQNGDLRKQMGKNGRALYEREYDWRIMKKRLVALYV